MSVSDVTLPNGYIVKSVPDGVSREEIKVEALKNGWATEKDFEVVSSSVPESDRGFVADQALRGAVDALYSLVPSFIEIDLLDVDLKEFQNADGTFRTEEIDQALQEKRDASAADLVGYKGVNPESKTEELLGTAARSLTSEGPMLFAGATKKVPSILGEALFSGTSALLGAAGQAVGSDLGEKWGLPTWGTEILGTVLGGTMAGTAGVTRGVFSGGADAAGVVKDNRKNINQSVDKAADYIVASEMKTVIDKATEAQPSLSAVIQGVKELEGQIPGLTVPPAAALADNPIFKKNTEQLLRTDPSFFAAAKKSLVDAKAAIDARKVQLFGKADQATDKAIRESLPKDYTQRIRGAERRIKTTQDKIDILMDKVVPKNDSVAVGETIDRLMSQKQKSVRDKLRPQYESLINKADRNVTVMSPKGVQRVSRVAELMKTTDNFASFPDLVGKIRSEWKPTEGTTFSRNVGYPEVSAREVDSLKRAINKSLRQTKDPDKVRMLNTLKSELRTSIAEDMPKSFSEPYSALDAQYYKELGIPMSTQGVRQLDSTRFASQAGTYLSKPEQAADFLSFVGEAGIPVVRDAVILQMNKAAIRKDGTLDVANLGNFLRNNARVVDKIPGLATELSTFGRAVAALSETKARIDADYSRRSKELTDGFLKGMHNKKLDGVVNEILASPKANAKYLRDLKNFDAETQKMIKQGVRASLLESGMKATSQSMSEFLQANQNVMDSWFGPTYTKDVRAIALASDQLNKLDLDAMRFATDYKNADAMSEKAGISFTQLQSVLRDRISGAGTKIAIIASKVSTSKVAGKRDSQMAELLLNPDSLKTIREAAENSEFSMAKPEIVDKMVTAINSSVSKGTYFGTVGAENQLQQEEQQQ